MFDAEADSAIADRLSACAIAAHPLNYATQQRAWNEQITLLRHALAYYPRDWTLLLEYPLFRLGCQIDTVLLTDRAILVLEFKIGKDAFDPGDRGQVEDYALDLFDFHAGCQRHPVVPILVATNAPSGRQQLPLIWHGVTPVLDATATTLKPLIEDVIAAIPDPAEALAKAQWDAAPYRPVPTIIEAAKVLYRRHNVEDLAASRADIPNLTRTTRAIMDAISDARVNGSHLILFVTGIPGAGKTLCGLNAVFGAETGAAFLTGNLPLVHVLREALAQDAHAQGRSLRVARHEAKSAIQPLIHFVRDNVPRSDPPHEHVIIFDEAQRAWDADYGRRKFGHEASEAALFLDIMRRHSDYAVVVALVGNGQEINTGEAGLAEWGRALLPRPEWQIRAAPGVLTATDPRQRLCVAPLTNLQLDESLHLNVPVRQIRSAAAAPWVDAVLSGEVDAAAAIAAEAGGVPFLITRSLKALRDTLRQRARGKRRAGLVCSTGAKRLRAEGLWPDFPHLDSDAIAHWFLKRWPDVRASDALEMPATEFACQGLELDLVGLCWGGDLIRGGQHWIPRSFSGTRWQAMRSEDARAYRFNTYRVLLTRARYETLIWVPNGDRRDQTRSPAELDATAEFLARCGARFLQDDAEVVLSQPEPALL